MKIISPPLEPQYEPQNPFSGMMVGRDVKNPTSPENFVQAIQTLNDLNKYFENRNKSINFKTVSAK